MTCWKWSRWMWRHSFELPVGASVHQWNWCAVRKRKLKLLWIFQKLCFPAGLPAKPSQGPVPPLQQLHKPLRSPGGWVRTVRKPTVTTVHCLKVHSPQLMSNALSFLTRKMQNRCGILHNWLRHYKSCYWCSVMLLTYRHISYIFLVNISVYWTWPLHCNQNGCK